MKSLAGPRSSEDAALPLLDFSDRLSPIIVRDLRRALRESVFTRGFLGLQVLAFLAVLLDWTVSEMLKELGGAGAFPGMFTMLTVFVFQLALPISFFNALQAELAGRNIELLHTSRLSPWQIVRGKFFVASAICGLMLVSLLPYYLFRYFIGGVELTAMFASLLDLIFHNAVMNAIVIGASVFTGPAVRVLIILYLVFASSIFFSGVLTGSPYGLLPAFDDIVVRAVTFAIFIILSLQLGKSKLNHPGSVKNSIGATLTLLLIFLALIYQLTTPLRGGPGTALSPIALTIILACALALDRGTGINKRWWLSHRQS